nr:MULTISPECIES: hypothetical protein [Clostridium]
MHRWDYNTPIEETMETLNDLVRIGFIDFKRRTYYAYNWLYRKW